MIIKKNYEICVYVCENLCRSLNDSDKVIKAHITLYVMIIVAMKLHEMLKTRKGQQRDTKIKKKKTA